MSGAHTPGPWTVSHSEMFGRGNKGTRFHVFEAEDYVVVPAPGQAGPVAIAAGHANARLISAAPQLLEAALDAYKALALLRIRLKRETASVELIDAHLAVLEDAVAKARGQS